MWTVIQMLDWMYEFNSIYVILCQFVGEKTFVMPTATMAFKN